MNARSDGGTVKRDDKGQHPPLDRITVALVPKAGEDLSISRTGPAYPRRTS